ncbi:MAG: hypothetical protein M8467_20645 [Anaerolineae bacterium]|nr:hypothetical protein [Anaerolineae bacterium]
MGKKANEEFQWLTDVLAGGILRWVFVALWILAGLGFVAAGLAVLGVLVPVELWRTLSIVSAVLSIAVAILFLGGGMNQPLFNALAMDVIILVALLLLNWPPESLIGA